MICEIFLYTAGFLGWSQHHQKVSTKLQNSQIEFQILPHVSTFQNDFFLSTNFSSTLRILSQEDQQLYSTFLRMAVESVSWSMVVGKTVWSKVKGGFFLENQLEKRSFSTYRSMDLQKLCRVCFFSKYIPKNPDTSLE